MKNVLIILFLISGYFAQAQEIIGDYYVAPNGSDSNPGSFTMPWKTFQKAFNVAKPGDTVYFRGGIYYSTKTNSIDPKAYVPIGNSGTAENPICYFGYPGEWPILDCSLHCNTPGVSYNGGIYIGNAQYIHFKGFELRNVFQCDATITGGISSIYSTNLTFEHIVMHDVGQRGFYISGGAWGEFTQDPAPSWDYDTTRFINCDVYDLVDTVIIGSPFPNPGNAADAWKTSCYGGNYFVWDGCRAWNYSDDGVDATSNEGGTQLFNNCWFMSSNKWEEYGVEGNGLKLSAVYSPGNGYQNDVFVTVKNSIFVYAGASGAGIVNNIFMGQEDHFLNNGAFYNNLSYRNGYGFFEFGYVDSLSTSTYKNNISFGSREIAAGSGRPMDFYNRASFINESHNTFDFVRGYPGFVSTDTVSFSDDDYIGIDSLTIVFQFTAPRKPDGSLPSIPVFQLAEGSDLIDAGTDIGNAYNGSAPDIGPFERDIVTGTSNYYPSVEIYLPENECTSQDDVAITANAHDRDGSINRVEFFFQGTDSIGVAFSAPWTFTWRKPPVGVHSLRAVAYDNNNAKSTSSRVFLTVIPDTTGGNDNMSFLFPNPNKGIFKLFLLEPLQSKASITIVSVEGKVVYRGTLFQNETIKQFDLSGIDAGFYMILLSNNEKILSGNKFIKQ